MVKLVLHDIVNLQNETSATNKMNENSARIEEALDNTLSRDGTSPNAMLANLDMNGRRILNLPSPVTTGEPLVFGDIEPLIPNIFVQNSEPSTSVIEGSLWIDADSTNQDLYQLVSGVWTDTGVNLKGDQGIQGPAGQDGTIAGSTGANDNRVLRADGTGGATLQSSGVTIDDSANITTAGYVQPASTRYANAGFIADDSGNEHIVFHKTASAVNQLGVTNSATGNAPQIAVEGDDTNIDLNLVLKGTGTLKVSGVSIYTNIPQNSQSGAYTAVLGDAGKHLLHPSSDNNPRTFTIPANASVAYPIGTTLTFINKINTLTIAITSDTLTQAGTGSTGSRTLVANGVATAVKIASTEWIISGAGLS